MRRILLTTLTGILACIWGAMPASSQKVPKSLQDTSSDTVIKERKNAWTVGVAGGLIDGTYMRFADEIAKVLDDGDNLRVVPIVTHGAASNLDDLLYMKGIDIAFTQADVFEFFRTQRQTPNLEKRVHYIARFPLAEVHIVARTEFKTLEDLRGKKVSFGPAGTAASLTGSIVFQKFGIEVEQIQMDLSTSMQKLRAGEFAAVVRVIGKPVDALAKLPANSGLHLLPIPFTKAIQDVYTLSEFTSQEYPTLVPAGQSVDTVAVPSVLAVYNWPKDTDRYRRVERFVERLFTNWSRLQSKPFHPKWRDINLAATVPGWTRFSVSERMLQRAALASGEQPQLQQDFETFLSRSERRRKAARETDREALFREFLTWRERQGTQRQ
jgi:TRAP transporter TAXI family solute receptor